MSTVLTNGIIIPDNGSRNWGGDLANNWNILDVNVGYMTDVKNRVTTLENSVAENTANIQINASNISALQTSKQDAIEDLETIRAGASAGATAVQPSALSNYVDLSSEQTITGAKTFSGNLLGSGSNNLGTSTNKWKTLNGINPGALSLPDHNSYLDIKGNLPASISDNLWLARCQITPERDGILILTFNDCSSAVVWISSDLPSYGDQGTSICIEKRVMAFVLKGVTYNIFTNNYSQVASARIFYCQGNV